jgi:low temperature requirement protein LtrA
MLRLLRIHTVPSVAEEGGSTWLQLFFDLVYVAILVELGNRLSHDMTLQGVLEFTFIFIPIWLSWLEFVNYGRHFPVDDIGQRLLTVFYMAFMLLLAFEIHAVTGATAGIFFLSYGFSKFVLALMYARAWAEFPNYREMTSHYTVAFIIGGLLWIGVALISPLNLWFLGLVTALSLFMPALIRLARKLRGVPELVMPPAKHHYMMHRFGELTIIVLGEFFIKLATTTELRELSAANLYFGLCLLGISVSIWWLYFDHLKHAGLTTPGSRIGFWIYSHYPFLATIIAYGVVGQKIFTTTPGAPLTQAQQLMFTTALAIALLAYGAIEWASREKAEPLYRRPQPWVRVGSAAGLLALGIWGGTVNAGLLVSMVVAIFLFQVGLDVYKRLQHPETLNLQEIKT